MSCHDVERGMPRADFMLRQLNEDMVTEKPELLGNITKAGRRRSVDTAVTVSCMFKRESIASRIPVGHLDWR